MSLKKFKTNPKLIEDGKWFTVTTNSDGSTCRVRLRRSGRANKRWLIKFREHTEGLDTDSLSPEDDAALMATVFAQACVAEWENMQPEDDGANLEFSEGNAVNLLTDPEWVDLLSDWQAKAGAAPNFRAHREGEAGN